MPHDPLPLGDRHSALRVVDANFNRAAEGLRVAEEFFRFHLNDRGLSERCKHLRHTLATAVECLPAGELAAARSALGDVGAQIELPTESARPDLASIAAASWQRVQQALRAIEEYSKLLAPDLAAEAQRLRYEAYTLAKTSVIAQESLARLSTRSLYALVHGDTSEEALERRVTDLVRAGVSMIQLREKQLGDRQLLARAYVVRKATEGTSTLFIMNDRPDIALLARADGIHVGQDDLSVAEVRRIVGSKMLVGVSTHNLNQVREAVLDGANYLGCGPVFPSSTKQFDQFAGLEFLRQVAQETSLPAFAIGGITPEVLPRILETGISRVAVGAALQGERPADAVHKFLRGLHQSG